MYIICYLTEFNKICENKLWKLYRRNLKKYAFEMRNCTVLREKKFSKFPYKIKTYILKS